MPDILWQKPGLEREIKTEKTRKEKEIPLKILLTPRFGASTNSVNLFPRQMGTERESKQRKEIFKSRALSNI